MRKTWSMNPTAAADPYPSTLSEASQLLERWFKESRNV